MQCIFKEKMYFISLIVEQIYLGKRPEKTPSLPPPFWGIVLKFERGKTDDNADR